MGPFHSQSSPFFSRLGTNYIPTDEEIVQIRKNLQGPSLRLKNLETEINQMRSSLQILEKTHDSLSSSIQEHMALISPVRRLPADIIQEIFLRCLPTKHNAVISATESPILLTRVCSTWRCIALTTPRLWSSIHIPVPSGGLGFHQRHGNECQLSIAHSLQEKHLATIQNWLGRSGACPLSISLFEGGGFHSQNYAFDKYIAVILPFSSRWKAVSIAASASAMVPIAALSATDVPILESLKIRCHGDMFIRNVPGQLWVKNDITQGPRLRELSLVRTKQLDTIVNMPTRNWSQLTTLTIEEIFFEGDPLLPVSQFCHLFNCCIQLINCRLQIGCYDDHMSIFVHNSAPISRPSLRRLSVAETGDLSRLFKTFVFPHLQEIEFDTMSPGQSTSLLSLLSTSVGSVRRLITDAQLFSTATFIACLQHCPYLISFCNKQSTSNILAPDGGYQTSLDDSMLHLLGAGALCPKLEEIECLTGVDFSEEALLQFIKRKGEGTQPTLSKLKRVVVDFGRPRRRANYPDFALHRTAGLTIELRYEPLPTPGYHRRRFSPYCGLSSGGHPTFGKSW